MTADYYTEATIHTYRPEPCPTCGSDEIDVTWNEFPDAGSLERKLIPGPTSCRACAERTRRDMTF